MKRVRTLATCPAGHEDILAPEGGRGDILLSNSLNLGVSAKVDDVAVEVNVDFYHAALAAGNLFQAATSYVAEKVQNIIHTEKLVPPQAR